MAGSRRRRGGAHPSQLGEELWPLADATLSTSDSPTLAASSSSSCSPPVTRQYNLRSKRRRISGKMSRDRANWSEYSISVLLDEMIKQKDLSYWSDRSLNRIGWDNATRAFNDITHLGYIRRQLQNKFADLKREYYNWRDGCIHTGLGREPSTGEVGYDPLWAACTGEPSSQTVGNKYKRPPCCEKLYRLLGHTPRERGELVSAGGVHGTQQTPPTPTGDTPETPKDMSDEPYVHQSGGHSTKRFLHDNSVSSPRKKSSQTPSVEDVMENLNGWLQQMNTIKSRLTTEAAELSEVSKCLKEDGYSECDDEFIHAKLVCKDRLHRRTFLDMETKEGRSKYVKAAWELMIANRKS